MFPIAQASSRVPMVIFDGRSPQSSARVVHTPTQLIDLFPTFMDLAAVPQKERPESLDGRSLATLVASTAESYADDGVVAQVARCALARGTILIVQCCPKVRRCSPQVTRHDLG